MIVKFRIPDYDTMSDIELVLKWESKIQVVNSMEKLTKVSDIKKMAGILLNLSKMIDEFKKRGVIDEKEIAFEVELSNLKDKLNID